MTNAMKKKDIIVKNAELVHSIDNGDIYQVGMMYKCSICQSIKTVERVIYDIEQSGVKITIDFYPSIMKEIKEKLISDGKLIDVYIDKSIWDVFEKINGDVDQIGEVRYLYMDDIILICTGERKYDVYSAVHTQSGIKTELIKNWSFPMSEPIARQQWWEIVSVNDPPYP